MKNQFSLNIKQPCQEHFNQFEATSNGGFCSSCEKEVIDFSNKSTQDITAFFTLNSTKNTCGRFKNHQLNTLNQKPQRTNRISLAASIGVACLSLFTLTTTYAQDKINVTNTSIAQQQEAFIVKGNVSDNLEPIPGVNILLEGTNIGTVTDFDGHFEFPQKLKKGDVLVFSYVGLESKKLIIENKESASDIALNINMKMDTVIIMGEVAVKEVYKSKRSK